MLFSQLQAISLNFQISGAKAISTLVKHSQKNKRGVSQIAALASVLGAWRPIARHIILQRERGAAIDQHPVTVQHACCAGKVNRGLNSYRHTAKKSPDRGEPGVGGIY